MPERDPALEKVVKMLQASGASAFPVWFIEAEEFARARSLGLTTASTFESQIKWTAKLRERLDEVGIRVSHLEMTVDELLDAINALGTTVDMEGSTMAIKTLHSRIAVDLWCWQDDTTLYAGTLLYGGNEPHPGAIRIAAGLMPKELRAFINDLADEAVRQELDFHYLDRCH